MLKTYDPNSATALHPSTMDRDYGTPVVANNSDTELTMVCLEIDGQSISVPEGTSIMRAAALLDINVPRLCATDSVEAFGSCRMCLVQIEGRNGFPAS